MQWAMAKVGVCPLVAEGESLVGVAPLVAEGGNLGLLALWSLRQPRPFSLRVPHCPCCPPHCYHCYHPRLSSPPYRFFHPQVDSSSSSFYSCDI